MIDLRYPNITGSTPQEQMVQMRSYLHQLVDQLQWAMTTIETKNTDSIVVSSSSHKSTAEAPKQGTVDTAATFEAVKAYIIKSADIVDAYYEEIGERLVSEYRALSEFGEFEQKTTQDIVTNSEKVTQLFTNVQEIESDIETTFKKLDVSAHIRSGELYQDQGVPVYGLEVGEIITRDGNEEFNKYARFTSDRLSFYDQNDEEIAYISDYKLHITHVEIKGTAQLGAFLLDTTNGFTLKWVGRG